MRSTPSLFTLGPAAGARSVVLLLHGGEEESTAPAARPGPAWLRMLPFALAVARATRGSGTAVWLLTYRVRGWNGPAEDPVVDARWALSQARRHHPGAPIVLVGHSMGGRVVLRLTADPDVAGVCALAPWLEPGDPEPVAAGPVLIAHGSADHITDPRASAGYASRTGAEFVEVPGEKHALLHRPLFWNRLVTTFARRVLAAVVTR